MFLISNYYFPSSIEINEGLVKFEDDIANLWEITGQSLGLLVVKLSKKDEVMTSFFIN